ncbi:MAG: rRNA maturation RNase YbeY [Phycisphaerae bacterium]|jgi:probable rRNA maturation factor
MASAEKRRNIAVLIAKNFKKINVSLPKLKKLVKFTCNRFKLSKAAISIAIVGDAKIRKVNKKFLRKDHPTDCISFDLSESKKNSIKSFELVVNGEMAVRYAKLLGHSGEAELALYITHGLLHNLGFDDSAKNQAEKMHNIEDQILQQIGFGHVYKKA